MHSKLNLAGRIALSVFFAACGQRPASAAPEKAGTAAGDLLINAIRYDGKLIDNEARFTVEIQAESSSRSDAALVLFEGDIALAPPKLPSALRITREGDRYRLIASRAGKYKFTLDLIAKVTRGETWNQVSFKGPAAGIGSVTAEATDEELQLLSGTPVPSDVERTPSAPSSKASALLGADRTVSLRWRRNVPEVSRQALVNCETSTRAQITPSVIKLTTQLRYDIVQGRLSELSVALPPSQTLVRVEGDLIREWRTKLEGEQQILVVELIQPVGKSCALTLYSERTIENLPFTSELTLPQPLNVKRESGSLDVVAQDIEIDTDPPTGLRQVNAPADVWAAYRFYGRPAVLPVRLRRMEPVINAASLVTARMDDARLTIMNAFTLTVEKAGIYGVELLPLTGFTVTDVRGDEIEDWKQKDGRLIVNFSNRVLGQRKIEVRLEQTQKTFPEQITIVPLRVEKAAKQTSQIGVASSPGIRLKTAELSGLREIPINNLTARTDDSLAYVADQADWTLKLAAERLKPRIIAEVFNLVTIGDGLLGGSATIRYAIANQGVQEFKLRLPARWKNLEFTGPNIRRKDQQGDVWTIGLQDKVWGGYTLVITYDEQFDPHKATLAVGDAHALEVERETGTIAVTSAANLQLRELKASEPLQRMDENELAESDRAMITRSVLLAYRYATGEAYELSLEAVRFQEQPVLEAVADRTQLTTVLTQAGQMLTQASFMVKNNDKQFQSFTLPAGADFWSCFVAGQAVKPERQGNLLLVPLPRADNRNQAFPVEIFYAQKAASLNPLKPGTIRLEAPKTDIQTTFAEWELYVPASHQLANFGGNMSVARGTTYGVRDAWQQFLQTYRDVLENSRPMIWITSAVVLLGMFGFAAVRRGFRGALTVLAVLFVVAIISSMFLPALARAKAKAVRVPAKVDANGAAGGQFGAAGLGAAGGGELFNEPLAKPGPASITGPNSAPRIAGLRPIRIEVPRTGQRYVFTKVLNVRDEPLSLSAWSVTTLVLNVARGSVQLILLLAGLLLIWREFRRTPARSFLIAAGLALVLGSAGSFLIAARLLGWALIVAVPLVAVTLLVVLARRFWSELRPTSAQETGADSSPSVAGGISPIAPVIALLFLTWAASAGQTIPTADGGAGPTSSAALSHAESVSIQSANYAGTVRDGIARIDAVIQVTTAKPDETVTLFGEEIAVEDFSATPGAVKLVRDGGFVRARLTRRGETTLRVKFLVKVSGDAIKHRLSFGIPFALSSRFLLTLDEPDAVVEMPTAVSFKITPDASSPKRTVVDGMIGATDRIELDWSPQVKRTAEPALTQSCQTTGLVTLGNGVMHVSTILDYQIPQGELRGMRVRLPAGQRLLHVEGESIRNWKVDGESSGSDEHGEHILVVELVKAVSRCYRLQVETEEVLAKLPVDLSLIMPQPLEVKRETGLLAVQARDEVAVSVESAEGLQKVDASEFLRSFGATNAASTEALIGAFQFLKPGFSLKVRVDTLLPQIEAVSHNRAHIGQAQITLDSQVDYQIKRVGVFNLRLALPPEFRVESVTGEKISQWTEKTDNGARVLEVALKERTMGAFSLHVQLVKTSKELPKTISIVGIHPLAVEKLTGYLTVATETGVQAKTESLDGLTEIPAGSVTDGQPREGAGGLAFKFTANDPTATQSPWKLVVATELVEPWIRAEIINGITLSETLASGRTVIRYEIANGPVKEFRFRVPAAFKNIEVSGANIRQRDQNGREWIVELQNRVIGTYTLTLTWEQTWSVKEKAREALLEAAGVEALGVERETGFWTVAARAPLQVSEKSASSELIRIDSREIPDWAGKADDSTVLAYRYLRPGYKLTLAAQRFEHAEVLQALAETARLTTVVAEDGQAITTLALAVRNNGRQHLEISLPPAARLWSAFVGGRAVRPSVREGKLSLPLDRAGSDDSPVAVELTYVSIEKLPAGKGRVSFASPGLDVPIKNARWEFYLPMDYEYRRFAGSMTFEPGAVPVYQEFSLVDYSHEEVRKKEAHQSELLSRLAGARRELEKGNVKEANRAYFNAGELLTDASAAKDFKQLELDLRRVQSSNLINAQQANFSNNSAILGESAEQFNNLPGVVPGSGDAVRTAEEQWVKLQQAQEVTAVKVSPLRVNLPTRGLRYSFAQVLQTEVGKPMSVQFVAANARAINWPLRIALAAAAFVLLWGIVAFALKPKNAVNDV